MLVKQNWIQQPEWLTIIMGRIKPRIQINHGGGLLLSINNHVQIAHPQLNIRIIN